MVKYITHKFREVSPFNLRNNYHIRKRQINCKINVREYRRGNQKWTIQRNWQHMTDKTKKNKTKAQHNMCWTPL
jgi:hypothetical protein